MTAKTFDVGAAHVQSIGVAGVAFTSADVSTPAAVTDSPGANYKLVIDDLIVSTDTALTISFTEETSGDLIWRQYMAAASTIQITPRGKLKLAVAAKKLLVGASAAGNVAVTAIYHSED
jgi:hypothetical protein